MTTHLPGSLPLLAAGTSNAALITFLIYTLAVFGLAWLSNRLLQSKSFLSEYFLGSRNLGVWAFALTFAATSASGGSFTGFPSKIYTHGWVLGLWIGSYIVVPICAMGFLGKRINQVARISGAITIPDVIRDRFRSATFGLLATLLIVFFMSFNLVGQFKAGSEILSTLLQDVSQFNSAAIWLTGVKSDFSFFSDVDAGYLLCLLTFAVAVIVYTAYGGFHAVVWTDVMQGIVMVVGVMVMLPLAIWQVGGLPGATRQMARMTPPRLGLVRLELDVPFVPLATDMATGWAITSPWFTLPGEDGELPRLFRVARTLFIPANTKIVEHARVVEITTPEEIERQLERLKNKDLVARFNEKIRELKNGQVRWIEQQQQKKLGDAARLVERVRQLHTEIGRLDSNQIALLASDQFRPVRIRTTLLKEYRFGNGRQGVYVTGPGPDPPALPSKPGTLAVEMDQEGAEIWVLEKDKDVEVARMRGRKTTYISLGEGQYRLYIEKAGFQPVTRPITVQAKKTETVQVAMTPSDISTEAVKPKTIQQPSFSSGFLPLSLAISFFFMWAIAGSGQPSSMVRLMAFRDTTTLRRAIFTVAIYYSMIYLPLVVIFCCARVLLPGMDLESDRIMPQMAVTLTSSIGQGWLAGLLVAAPFAAVMSTVDSFLLMISSALVRDVYQRSINPEVSERTIKRLSYLFTLTVGVGATLGAVNPPQFLQDVVVYTGSGLAACFLGPMVFALYWPRANATGCISGMAAGFAVHLSMYIGGIFANGTFFKPYRLANFDPIIVGLFVSFATVYVVTKLTQPPPEELVRKYFCRE